MDTSAAEMTPLETAETALDSAFGECLAAAAEARDYPAARTRYQHDKATERFRLSVITYTRLARGIGRLPAQVLSGLTDIVRVGPGLANDRDVVDAAIGWSLSAC